MGICDSNAKINNYVNMPTIKHVQTLGDPENDCYKFDYQENNNLLDRKLNLKFIFYNFKVKYCISHRASRDSIYITEIKIGEKTFPLIINQGQSPNIPNYEDIYNGFFEQREYTLSELENTFLLINIYEFLEDIRPSLNDSLTILPNEYKAKCNYNSFFRISLFSFLFKSMKCDFSMMGNNQLSLKTRIAFNCYIEHREKITIKAKSLINSNISKLVLRLNTQTNLESSLKEQDNLFTLISPPITMNEFQRADLLLETNESKDNYDYISLNGLKAQILRELGHNLLAEENSFRNIIFHKPVNVKDYSSKIQQNNFYNLNNSFDDYRPVRNLSQNIPTTNLLNQRSNQKSFLFLDNLPIIGQISNLYFTEYGNLYSTAILNLINNDPEINNYRQGKQISSEDFYKKLENHYKELSKPEYDIDILNEMHVLLMRSIDTDRFMFLYQSKEQLNKMVLLLLNVGLKLIEKVKTANEEYKVIFLTKLINILMRREELDNAVIYDCINTYNSTEFSPKPFYNQIYIELFHLYTILLSNQYAPNNDSALIELFSRLYFQKKYFRLAILRSLYGQEYQNDLNEKLNQNDILLYDIINDERLNEYLKNSIVKGIKNYLKTDDNFKNKQFDNYRLLKRILAFMNDENINQYPLDFTLFLDNVRILTEIMKKDIYQIKLDNKNDNSKLTNDFYESAMLLSNSYISISNITNTLIKSTNGHNPNAVYTLFIYLKSLLDYYSSASNLKLLMDYSVFQEATKLLSDNEDSLSLPRLFWFYYCCSNMIPSGNLKWFIVNIINKNFEKFAFHWSFTIRQVFFKLALFILSDKLKEEEGILFKREKLQPFIANTLNTEQNPYIKESCKDFNTIMQEYNEWLERRKADDNCDYPMFFLPPPITNNGVID